MNTQLRVCAMIFFAVLLFYTPFYGISYADDLKITGKDSNIFKKAAAHELEGQIPEAIAGYKLYLKKNKDVVPAYFYLGNLYWDSGDKAKALETFKQAEKACPT